MRPLSAAELLTAWEQGSAKPAYGRTFPLLATACPDLSIEMIEQLSIGQRDARLLKLREWTFGSQLPSVTDCPRCGERLEWTVNTGDLSFEAGEESTDEMMIQVGDYSVRFLLPNSLDLGVVSKSSDSAGAQAVLLERCVLEARIGDRQLGARELGPEVTTAIARRMSQVDPQAEVQMDLTCPSCGHIWQTLLDIETFFWAELSAWAKRILSEVHVLASAYGWREADILNLSPLRRQYYLEFVNG